jgi:hypothetical protein
MRVAVTIASVGSCPALLVAIAIIGSAFRGCDELHHRSGDGDISLSVSPDGRTIAFAGHGAGGLDLYLLDLKTRRARGMGARPAYETDSSFSPDGLSIVYAAGVEGRRADHLFVRPVAGGPARPLAFDDANDSALAYSRDGSQLLFFRGTRRLTGGLMPWGLWGDDGIRRIPATGGTACGLIRTGDFALAGRVRHAPSTGTGVRYGHRGVVLFAIGSSGRACRQ